MKRKKPRRRHIPPIEVAMLQHPRFGPVLRQFEQFDKDGTTQKLVDEMWKNCPEDMKRIFPGGPGTEAEEARRKGIE